MNTADTLRQTELAIAGLSDRDRRTLFDRFFRDADHGIDKRDDVMGGAACVRDSRIPIWLLYRTRELGLSEGDILKSYPGLTAMDLVNAWKYAEANIAEIESHIAENESEA